MSFIKISSSVIAKSFLLVFLLSSGFFLSGAKAEASSTMWKYSYTFPGYWTSMETYDFYTQPRTAVLATFFASTNKSIYTVGETASVTVSVAAGDQGNSFNGWDPIMNGLLNFFFGSSTPYVGVAAYFGPYQVAQCDAAGSCSSTQSIVVAVPPGNYSLSLGGCYNSANGCAPSSLPFSVVCPGGTSWDGSNCVVPALVPVNAVCGTTHYSCTAGRHVATGGVNQVESASGYTWHCGGSNGGSDATNCSEQKAPCSFSGYVSWPPGCGANASGSLPSGASTTVTNTNAGYSGSKNYSCSNGTWIAGSESCSPVADPVAPTLTFTANPTSIATGGSSTLTWSTNAASCWATGGWTGWKTVGNNISAVVSPVATATYTLECWNSSGVSSGQRNATVTVGVVASAPTLTFIASPSAVSSSGGSTLNWSTTNAVSCTASGDWSGAKAVPSGAETQLNITADKTYTLECQNSVGTKVSKTVTIAVTLE